MADIKKLFTLGINDSPDTSQRLAFGRDGAASENMTLAKFITWMTNAISSIFMQGSNNLDELTNVTAARAKLEVYSTTQVDTLVSHTDTGWHDGTESSTDVEDLICKAAQYGRIVTVNGQLKITGDPGAGILFTLPAEVGAPSVDVYFCACDAAGTASENIEMKVGAGTKNVYSVDFSQDKVSSFNFTYYT